MALSITTERLGGTAGFPDASGHFVKVEIPSGETAYVSFPWTGGWGPVAWQVVPSTGATVTVKTTIALAPADADWVDHATHSSLTAATIAHEAAPVRHLSFAAATAGATLYLTSLQPVRVGDAAENLKGKA